MVVNGHFSGSVYNRVLALGRGYNYCISDRVTGYCVILQFMRQNMVFQGLQIDQEITL